MRGLAIPEIETVTNFREISLARSFHTYAPSFEEIFERLWSNFDLLTRPKAEKVESLTVDVPLSPDEISAGGTVRILIPARARCEACEGKGRKGRYECWYCQGHGSVTAEWPVELSYPAGLQHDSVVRLPLHQFGIQNFYLTVRFRPSAAT